VIERDSVADALAGVSLFADLTRPQLEGVAHTFEEEEYSAGQRIVRQGFAGAGFCVLIEGEVSVAVDGQERARLARGDFFGEISLLLGEPPVADVVALGEVRCLVLPGHLLESFLFGYPRVMFRILQAQARRLRGANQWAR
jgi:CRP-like cAMP-binding protein